MKNIIVTGIPRSGTSLLTTLIDSAPNAIGLHEPNWQASWVFNNKALGKSAFVDFLKQDFARIRSNVHCNEPIFDRRDESGNGVTNYYAKNPDGSIRQTYKLRPIKQKSADGEFTLAMKHCGLYLGVLEEIVQSNQFAVIAIIRSKKSVLESWRRIPNIPPHRGRLPGAEIYCNEIREIVGRDVGLEQKQEYIYDYAFRKITQTKGVNVVYYDDLLHTKLTGHPFFDSLGFNYDLIKNKIG